VDNGDGTVTDNDTGLQWEKKDNNCPGIHCVDDTYTWCVDANPQDFVCDNGGIPDGTAFTSFLDMLNGGATGVGNCVSSDGSSQTGGFDNHCDWRLPTIVELQTIIDPSASGCGNGSSPCIDATFGPTAFGPTAAGYWSSTTFAGNSSNAWEVGFRNGNVSTNFKLGSEHVRAVRGGSACTGGKALDASGMCVCPTGKVDCNGTCTDTQTDANNCGTCGNVCAADQVCNAGACCTPKTTADCTSSDCGPTPDGCRGSLACPCSRLDCFCGLPPSQGGTLLYSLTCEAPSACTPLQTDSNQLAMCTNGCSGESAFLQCDACSP
jgi:hypothetical protein